MVLWRKILCPISQQFWGRFGSNFTYWLTIMQWCAYNNMVRIHWFSTELLPFDEKSCSLYQPPLYYKLHTLMKTFLWLAAGGGIIPFSDSSSYVYGYFMACSFVWRMSNPQFKCPLLFLIIFRSWKITILDTGVDLKKSTGGDR